MRAVVTVIGRDKVGIIARVSKFLSDRNINIEDISQTIMGEYFTMIMLVGMEKAAKSIGEIQKDCENLANEIGMSIRIQHEDIFNAMHSI